ncbi:MAG: magnesium chelatase domain-containing protein [Stellaceae bacterium]
MRAALTAMGLALPARRIIVNLAPADLLKEGSHFDLLIALGLLAAMDVLPGEELERFVALGELALDGSLLPMAGMLPAALGAAAAGRGAVLSPHRLRLGRAGALGAVTVRWRRWR